VWGRGGGAVVSLGVVGGVSAASGLWMGGRVEGGHDEGQGWKTKGEAGQCVRYLHRPNAALHPDEPLHHLPVLVRVEGVGDLAVDVVLLGQVQHDGAAFEHGRLLRLAVRFGRLVDDGGDSTICYRISRVRFSWCSAQETSKRLGGSG